VREGYAVRAEEAARAMGVAPATIDRIVERIIHPREGGGMPWQAAEAAVDEAADAVVDCDSGDKLLARATNGPADRWSGRAAAEHCRCPLFCEDSARERHWPIGQPFNWCCREVAASQVIP